MSAGIPTITLVNTASGNNSATATIIAAETLPANTQVGDLVICLIYERGGNISTTPPKDTSDGWIFLDYGYNATNNFGMVLAAWICTFTNATDLIGITLPSTTSHSFCMASFRLPAGYYFNHSKASGSLGLAGWFNATVSTTSLFAPAIAQPYAQCLDIIGRGYGADGTGVTTATVTDFIEIFDAGQLAPPQGLVLNHRTVTSYNVNDLVSSITTAAKIDRGGVRAMIPIVSRTSSNRYMSPRRLF